MEGDSMERWEQEAAEREDAARILRQFELNAYTEEDGDVLVVKLPSGFQLCTRLTEEPFGIDVERITAESAYQLDTPVMPTGTTTMPDRIALIRDVAQSMTAVLRDLGR